MLMQNMQDLATDASQAPRTPAHPAPDFAARLRFLQSPAAHTAHAVGAEDVQTVETHMSWLFLVGDSVLKLKKTVRYAFLDFSTLAAREFNCREELRLNARLAPGVYRGLLALRWGHGQLMLQTPDAPADNAWQTLDWLVWMRRLPAERMLDRLIAERTLMPHDIAALSQRLAEFYRTAPVVELRPADYLARFERELAISRELLLRPSFVTPASRAALQQYGAALCRHGGLVLERAAQRHIVDGHGDLRPEHVCLLQPPVVIDCLEFNAELRAVDMMDELAFLGLECEVAGDASIGPRLLADCAHALHDTPAPALLHLYTAARALLRARLALAHLLEPAVRTPERWPSQARRYIEKAAAALQRLNGATPDGSL
jgi:uncharacterized protein